MRVRATVASNHASGVIGDRCCFLLRFARRPCLLLSRILIFVFGDCQSTIWHSKDTVGIMGLDQPEHESRVHDRRSDDRSAAVVSASPVSIAAAALAANRIVD